MTWTIILKEPIDGELQLTTMWFTTTDEHLLLQGHDEIPISNIEQIIPKP